MECYRNNDCDGFVARVNIDTGNASRYKLIINDQVVGEGLVNHRFVHLEALVPNNNPGGWKLVLYKSGNLVGIPVWGYIYTG